MHLEVMLCKDIDSFQNLMEFMDDLQQLFEAN